jgi:hypothetical protein
MMAVDLEPAVIAADAADGAGPGIVVAPGTHRLGGGRGGKPRRPRSPVRWTKTMRRAFLDRLATSCNVRASAAAIDVTADAAYNERRRNPAFAAEWAVALASGYELLELKLVGHALGGGGETVDDGDAAGLGPIDQQLALKLMTYHRGVAAGRHKRAVPRIASPEETDRVILAKLAMLATRRRARPAPAADDAAP